MTQLIFLWKDFAIILSFDRKSGEFFPTQFFCLKLTNDNKMELILEFNQFKPKMVIYLEFSTKRKKQSKDITIWGHPTKNAPVTANIHQLFI